MHSIDGRRLLRGFGRAAGAVARQREHLDAINVFPVADADTGTNLSLTLAGAVADTEPHVSAGIVAARVADAALLASVGNSGIIMAQFLGGLAEGVGAAEAIDGPLLARAAARGAERAHDAVAMPRDGTILSVMRAWADDLAAAEPDADPAALLTGALPAAEAALAATRRLLREAAAAGVVDAGAEGLVIFLGGFAMGLDDAATPDAVAEIAAAAVHETACGLSEPPSLRFCTEIVLEDTSADAAALRSALADLGASLIVAGRAPRLKVHLHCDQPDEAAGRLRQHGRLGRQKVDDMCLQYAAHHRPLAATAIVTDTTCDLPQALLDRWQIHQVPLSIQWGADQYIDRRTLGAPRFYAELNARPRHPTTSQPPPARFDRLYRQLGASHREVLSLHLAESLSGTVNAARLAAEQVRGLPIRVVALPLISVGLGLAVLDAAEAVAAGADAARAAALAQERAARIEVMVAVAGLESMVRGGRVSGRAGRIAGLLGLRPIISLNADGGSRLIGAARSFDGAVRGIRRRLSRRQGRERVQRWALAHGGCPEVAAGVADLLGDVLGTPPAWITESAPVLGVHAGTGSVCVAVQWADQGAIRPRSAPGSAPAGEA